MTVTVRYDFQEHDPRYPDLGLQQSIGLAGGPSNDSIPYLHFAQVAHLATDGDAPGNGIVISGGLAVPDGGTDFHSPIDIAFVTLTPVRGIPLQVRDLSFQIGYIDSASYLDQHPEFQLVYVYGGVNGGVGDVIRTINPPPTLDGWWTVTVPDRNVSRILIDSGLDAAGLGMKWIEFTLESVGGPLKVLTEDGWKKANPQPGENGGFGRLKILTETGWYALGSSGLAMAAGPSGGAARAIAPAGGATRATATEVPFGCTLSGDGWWTFVKTSAASTGYYVKAGVSAQLWSSNGESDGTEWYDPPTTLLWSTYLPPDRYWVYAEGGVSIGKATLEWGAYEDLAEPESWRQWGFGALGMWRYPMLDSGADYVTRSWSSTDSAGFQPIFDADIWAEEFNKAASIPNAEYRRFHTAFDIEAAVQTIQSLNAVSNADYTVTTYNAYWASSGEGMVVGGDAKNVLWAQYPDLSTYPPDVVDSDPESPAGTLLDAELQIDWATSGQDGVTGSAVLRTTTLTVADLDAPGGYDPSGAVVHATPLFSDQTADGSPVYHTGSETINIWDLVDHTDGELLLITGSVITGQGAPDHQGGRQVLTTWQLKPQYLVRQPRFRFQRVVPDLTPEPMPSTPTPPGPLKVLTPDGWKYA